MQEIGKQNRQEKVKEQTFRIKPEFRAQQFGWRLMTFTETGKNKTEIQCGGKFLQFLAS